VGRIVVYWYEICYVRVRACYGPFKTEENKPQNRNSRPRLELIRVGSGTLVPVVRAVELGLKFWVLVVGMRFATCVCVCACYVVF